MPHSLISVLTFVAILFSGTARAAEKSSPPPRAGARPADPSELIALLGHPLPKGIGLLRWDKSKPLTILLRGQVTGLESKEASTVAVQQLLGDLRSKPNLAAVELTSVVNDEAGGKTIFEITLTRKNLAYASLIQLAANSSEVEVASTDPATGIVKLRNKKRGGLIAVDTKTYTPANIGEVFEKISAANAAAETADDAAVEKEAAEERAAQRAGTASTLESNGRKFPYFLPAYPGATAGKTQIGTLQGGMRTYEYFALSRDKPEAITDFYFQKLNAAHFTASYHGPGGIYSNRTDPPADAVLELKTQANGQVTIHLTGVLKERY